MKLHVGLLHLDGRPVFREDADNACACIKSRQFDISGEVHDGPLYMAYCSDRITSEEESETQPLSLGPYILVWDGRLDNREEICDHARLRRGLGLPDPEIILKAYEACGEPILPALIGEFALVLWHRRTQRLLFARSTCGSRPLYYVQTKQRLMWCSNFAHLVQISRIDLDVNDEYVLQHLITTPDNRQTPLARVHAIAPNRITSFENGHMRMGRELWNPIHFAPLPYRTDHEFEEECRHHINQAVRVRLRSKYPVFAELSGGLDSSTIVLTADRLLRNQRWSARDFHTVSCVYEKSTSADERPFIRAVEEKRGIATHLIHEADQRITLGLGDCPFTGLPHTLHCFPGRYERIAAIMAGHNARVLLTGRGGDHLFWAEPDGSPIVADALRKLHFFQAHRECNTWSRGMAVPYHTLLASKALPLTIESLFPGRNGFKKPEVPDWVHLRHQRAMQQTTTDFDGYERWPGKPSQRAHVFVIDRMMRMLGSGFGQEYEDIYISHPYSHRPLVEFCVRTPIKQFLRAGQFRSLMRRAMADLLPSKTIRRVSKGLIDETIIRALQREWAIVSDLMNWQICQRGYVMYPQLSERLNQARLGIVDQLGPLVRLFSLERWLRSLSRVQEPKQGHIVSNVHFSGIGELST